MLLLSKEEIEDKIYSNIEIVLNYKNKKNLKEAARLTTIPKYRALKVGEPIYEEMFSLFIDMRNSTSLIKKIDKFDSMILIQSYLPIVDYIIDKFNGITVDFAGDGVMALWRTNKSEQYIKEKVINAACYMHKSIEEVINPILEDALSPNIFFHCGIGISKGKVIVTPLILYKSDFQLIAIGDSLNEAAHLSDDHKGISISKIIYRPRGKFIDDPCSRVRWAQDL